VILLQRNVQASRFLRQRQSAVGVRYWFDVAAATCAWAAVLVTR
jgi:hypothetical protein